MTKPQKVWTVGHSTRTSAQFVDLLRQYDVHAIADVRRFPGSRRLPHFGEDALRTSLADQGIDYLWIPQLGGRRRPVPNTPNTAWRNTSFRGYADHLESEEFSTGLQTLLAFSAPQHTALMCAELLWWRCHRALISDVLQVDGIEVLHIQDEKHLIPHPYTSPAKIIDGQLTYQSPPA